MSEEQMVERVQAALRRRGVEDEVIAVGEFNPRGHSGGLFMGGLAAGEVVGHLAGAADSIGVAAGSLAGQRAADARSGH